MSSKKVKYDWDLVIDLFGVISDKEIASILGCSREMAGHKRRSLGVAPVKFSHTEETKKAIGLASKGNKYAFGSKRSEESKRKSSDSLKSYYANNPDAKIRSAKYVTDHYKDPKNRKACSERMKKRMEDFPELKKECSDRLVKLSQHCNWYNTPIGKVQGKGELKYINTLIEEGRDLPSRGSRIKTPHGYYYPDFEFEDRLIEIKCKHTFDVCVGLKPYMTGGKVSDTQMKKINYTRDFVKPVQIIII